MPRHPSKICCTNLKLPQIAKATATHAAVDDETVSVVRLAGVCDAGVRLARRRGLAVCLREIPQHRAAVWLQLQCVEVVQVTVKHLL